MGLRYAAISLLLGISIGAECKNPAAARQIVGGAPRVRLTQGTAEGFLDLHNNSVFLGIPFADTTGGQNRWKAPQDIPKADSDAVFDATQYGATCPQAISGTLYSQQGEDCLNLNVWAPAEGFNLPVFVYIYGGAMVTGSSSNPQLQGNNFARKDAIFVSFNTRESIFAYPNSIELESATESQNFGILDVDKALEWVYENIAAFGGNPNHVVLGGHSSGAVQVDHYLWNHPDTKLVGAVQMAANAKSGPAVAPINQALDIVAVEVGCPTGAGQLECLRSVDLYDFQTEKFNATYNTWFTPAVDNITRYQDYESRFAAGKYASHVPLLTGNSDGEGAIFSLVYGAENTDFDAWIDTFDADSAHVPNDLLLAAYNASDYATVSQMSGAQYGDARFFCPVDYLLDLRSTKQETWVYRFFGDYANVVGAPVSAPTHGTEIPFFLGGNECFDSISGVTEAQQALADFQNDWFVAWVKNPSAGPGWSKASPRKGSVAKLGVPGNELAIELASAGDYNGRCQSVYNPNLPRYPVIQDVHAI
ncbi:acetylcholinesterase precursor [Stagonosporopsis vannaccii]|nr:acetylcholinesterase precursor [Stagonosporopsis vannaccii]